MSDGAALAALILNSFEHGVRIAAWVAIIMACLKYVQS